MVQIDIIFLFFVAPCPLVSSECGSISSGFHCLCMDSVLAKKMLNILLVVLWSCMASWPCENYSSDAFVAQ